MSFKIFNTESFQKGVSSSNISGGGGSGEDDSKFVYEIGEDKTYTTIQSAIDQYNIDRPVTVYGITGSPLLIDRLTAIFKIYPGQYKENISIPLRYSFLKFIGVDWSRPNVDNPVWFEGTVTVVPDSNPYIPDGGPPLYNGQVIFENISFIHTSVQTENTIIIPNYEGGSDVGIEIEFERCYIRNQNITLGDNNEHSYKGCYLINSKIVSDGSSNAYKTRLNFSNTTLDSFTIGDNKIRNLNINDCEISRPTDPIKISGVCDIKNSIIKQESSFSTFTFDKAINDLDSIVTPTLNIYNSNIIYLTNDTFIDINETGYNGIYIININNNVITNSGDTNPVPLMILDNNSSPTDDSTVTFINNTIINNDSTTTYNIIETEESYPSGGNLTVFYSSNILSRGVAATIFKPGSSTKITLTPGVTVTA